MGALRGHYGVITGPLRGKHWNWRTSLPLHGIGRSRWQSCRSSNTPDSKSFSKRMHATYSRHLAKGSVNVCFRTSARKFWSSQPLSRNDWKPCLTGRLFSLIQIMGSSQWIDEILRMINIQVNVAMFVEVNVCFPLISYDCSPWAYMSFYDRDKCSFTPFIFRAPIFGRVFISSAICSCSSLNIRRTVVSATLACAAAEATVLLSAK